MDIVFRHNNAPRTFKACRSCRQQKSRCIGPTNAPCNRCQATGRDCVFDVLSTKKRPQEPERAEETDGPKRPRQSQLEDEVQRLRRDVNTLLSNIESRSLSSASRIPERRPPQHTSELTPGPDAPGQVPSPDVATHSEGLNLLHLEAPITAVHAMTMGITSPPASQASNSPSNETTLSTSHTFDSPLPSASKPLDDIVSRGLLSVSRARELFDLFMARANVFLPLFDPMVDTFDSLRQRSTLCFTAVLAIAFRVHRPSPDSHGLYPSLWEEARRLAANSLFMGYPDLETVQGMILLASYSEKNWFAIKHAGQLGQDLRLHQFLPQLLESHRSHHQSGDSRYRRLLQGIRTWLVLHHIEQEVVDGTARRTERPPVSSQMLRSLIETPLSTSSEIRISSTIEIVQLRGQALREIESLNNISVTGKTRIEKLQSDVGEWFCYWDSVYSDHGIAETSFHRSSLRLQKEYAFIIVCSVVISKTGREQRAQTVPGSMMADMDQIIQMTVDAIIKQLKFVSEDDAYRWNLPWAPTYSALMLAFITALALCLARFQSHLIDWPQLSTTAMRVTTILDEYPNSNFASIVRELLKINSGSSCMASPNDNTDSFHGWLGNSIVSGAEQISNSRRSEHQPSVHTTPSRQIQPDAPPTWTQGIPAPSVNEEQSSHSEASRHEMWSSYELQTPFSQDLGYDFQQGMESSSTMLSMLFDYNAFAASMGT